MSDSSASEAGFNELSVLHITPYYPPDRIGGVGEVARTIHEGLLGRGLHSEVLSSGTTTSDPLVHRVGKTPARFALSSWRALRLARRFDVVHVHHGEALALLLVLRFSGLNRPRLVATFHSDLRAYAKATRDSGGARGAVLAKLAARWLADLVVVSISDTATAVSQSVAEAVRSPIRKATVSVVPNGVDAMSPGSVADLPETTLLYVGRGGSAKRTDSLPEILRRVQAVHPETTLRVVGLEPGEEARLEAAARGNGVGNSIHLEGVWPASKVRTVYGRSQILVLPSAHEGMPLVLLEGLRAGLLCVATDIPGHREVLTHLRDGLLAPVDDGAGLAEQCIWALANPDEARRIATRGLRLAAIKYSVDSQLDGFYEIYRG